MRRRLHQLRLHLHDAVHVSVSSRSHAMIRPRPPSLAVAWLLVTHAVLHAATFTVNSPTDAPDANPGDAVCATSGPTPVCTLRAAIQQANAHAGDDTITIPADTYALTL